jgi:formate-dependent nitrite reductase membrane component NrfD
MTASAPAASYYGLPAVKASHYRFLIITYFFIGGLAGAAQVIATIADLFGTRSDLPTVRAGRYLALAGAIASPALLILDLPTKERWLNMLRIFRPTSPMSIGSWTLAAFGTWSGLAATGQLLDQLFDLPIGRAMARMAGIPAALTGLVMSCYTGALLGATSTPVWSAGYRVLPALFAASSMATATAAISLVGYAGRAPRSSLRRLERLALVAGAAELALSVISDRVWDREGVAEPLRERPLAAPYRLGAQLAGMLAPLALHAWDIGMERASPSASIAAALLTLIGGYCLRAVVVLAGNASAGKPEVYLRQTRMAANDQ